MGARSLLTAVVLSSCALGGATARAMPVTWAFDATIRSFELDPSAELLTQLAALGIVEGAPLSGLLSFDSDSADTDPSPSRGLFTGAVLSATADVGSLHQSLRQPPPIDSAFISRPEGTYQVASWVFSMVVPPGLANLVGQLELVDADALAFSYGALPVSPPALDGLDPFDPDLPAFNTSFALGFSGLQSGDATLVRAELECLVLVPEPRTALLLALGLTGLGLAARRLRQRR